MCQYAAARRLAHKHNTVLKLDISEFSKRRYKLFKYELGGFNITAEAATLKDFFALRMSSAKWYRWLYKGADILGVNLNKNYIIEKSSAEFDPSFLNFPDNVYLVLGHWTSYRYFEDIETIIRQEFTPKKIGKAAGEIIDDIKRNNAVSMHVRRGDFVGLGVATDKEYYKEAISAVNARVKNPKFFIFSDDIQWVKENVNFNTPVKFISSVPGITICEEIFLMSLCPVNILSKYSTFGWWGGFLGDKNKLWIIPKNLGDGTYRFKDGPKTIRYLRV